MQKRDEVACITEADFMTLGTKISVNTSKLFRNQVVISIKDVP